MGRVVPPCATALNWLIRTISQWAGTAALPLLTVLFHQLVERLKFVLKIKNLPLKVGLSRGIFLFNKFDID